MTVLAHAAAPMEVSAGLPSFRLALFARSWALVALFHLAGNAREALVTSPPLAAATVVLGVAAVLTLLSPRLSRLVLLCVAVPVTAWYEAPIVGNHWVLASAVSLVVLLAVGTPRLERVAEAEAFWSRFEPTARLALIAAYGFAAFAKLNTDFLDPLVSCATYYHDQLVGSWGLGVLAVGDAPVLGRGVAMAAAAVELTVAASLLMPRLRRAGLVLAVGFHWVLAMDLAQHFWDFSSVLFACFLLFLDETQVVRLQAWTAEAVRRVRRFRAVGTVSTASAGVLVVALAVLPVSPPLDVALVLFGHLAWWVLGTGVVLVVLLLARSPRPAVVPLGLRPPVRLLLLVPVLVVLNGLTPYLEVKTGWGWNMYSNLRTVAGESNHLILPGTLDLTGLQRDQVRVLRSSDAALQELADRHYLMVYSEFREYAHANPDVSASYTRGGRTYVAERLRDDPAGQGGVTAVSDRLQSFRVIDGKESERCQPTFSPAR